MTIAKTFSLILPLFLLGCARQAVMVYESTGARQCESGGLTLVESREKLEAAGVEVRASDCAALTGVFFIAVCGGPTGNIILHEIDARDYGKTESLGFTAASSLTSTDKGLGYEVRQCPGSNGVRPIDDPARF